jgi:transposase-like protein
MITDLLFYKLLWLALVWLCLILHMLWPTERTTLGSPPITPTPPRRQRSKERKPFPGLLHKPLCEACEQAADTLPQLPGTPPPLLTATRGRKRTIDTQQQFCPDQDCSYFGWLRRGNIRANGHPGGKPWRQFQCVSCHGYFQQTYGTPLHGKRVSPDLLVWASGALAEGLGIRAVARVFEVDANTVLAWLVEVADHAAAFSQYFLHDVRVTQVQLDELFALLSAVKAGAVSETEAITRLSRSPHWVWTAMDPVTKLLLTIAVGDRTLAMAPRVVHQVVEVLAPGLCAPLPDRRLHGVRHSAPHPFRPVGAAVPPPRQRATPQAALEAAAAAPLCAGGEDGAAPAPGAGVAPRGVWHLGDRQCGVGSPWLADQHRFHRAPQPDHASACGGGGTAGHHAVQGRGWYPAAAGLVSHVL